MDEKIVTVLNEMSEYLSIAQMKKLQEVIISTFAENEVAKKDIPNDEFLEMFLAAKQIEGCSERTINYYRVTVEHLLSQTDTSVRKITTEEIREYLANYQKRNNCSNVTVDNIRRNISSFFSWLEEEDYILKSPMKRIHKIKTKTVVKSVISDEGIERLRDNCVSKRDLAIIDLLYSTGIRVGELVNLNIEDIDLDGRECVVYGKGDKERRVYFDAKAKVHLRDYIESREDNILLKECATIPEVKAKLPQLKELINDDYWNTQDILKFEETRKSLRSIMKFIPVKKIKIHYTNFEDEVVFREEGRKLDLTSDDFEDYKERVNEYIEAHKSQPTINKLLHNEPISIDDYQELERIFTEELGTCEDYQMNYQDTPFGLLIRKIAKMNRDAAYAAFSSFIAEERPNAEQIHFIEQVVDYVVENGYINNVLDLMKAPFDRPYKFSMIFTRDEQIKFVQIINSIKNNALIA